MKQYSFSDMNRSSGEILEMAMIEPVVLTKHGKEKLIVLSARDYHRLAVNRARPSPIPCMMRPTMSMRNWCLA